MKLHKVIISTMSLLFTLQTQAYTVGVAMPTPNEDRWYHEGFELEQQLKSKALMLSCSSLATQISIFRTDRSKD